MQTTPNTNPAIKNGVTRVILFLIISFIVCGISQLIFTSFLNNGFLYQGNSADAGICNILQSYTFTNIGIILCAWLFMKYLNNQDFKSLGFAWKTHQKDAYLGFFIGFIILAIGTFILLFNNNIYYLKAHFNALELTLAIILFIVVAFVEEIAIRGYVLNNLMQSMNKWLALAISAIVFSLLHLNNPDFTAVAFINIFVAGLLLGINYIYTKNLWFGIFLHFSWNFFQGPILGYKVSGIDAGKSLFQQMQQGSKIFTGGNFGFEGSIISVLLQLMCATYLAWYYQKR